MAAEKKIFHDLFKDEKLSKRLDDPADRQIVEETLQKVLDIQGLKPQEPLSPADVAYFLSNTHNGLFYYLCGLITPQMLKSIPDLLDAKVKKLIPGNVRDVLNELKDAFEIKYIQLGGEEAFLQGQQMPEDDYFDMEKEKVENQTPYDFMSDFVQMRNYQLMLNYFSRFDTYEYFVDAACLLNDVICAKAMNAINNLRHLTHSFDNDDIVDRVLAMCELFESVAGNEEAYGAMTQETIKSLLKDVDVHLRNGIRNFTEGDEAKKTKYLQLVDLLTKPKKDIPFLDTEKKEKQDAADREAFIQKVWGEEKISKQTLDEIDFAVGAEILETMATNIGKSPEDIDPDDVLIYLTDTNAANLYYTCGFLSKHEYDVFYHVMEDLEQAYDSGIEAVELKDFNLPQLLDKAAQMNPRISSRDKQRILKCYENYAPEVEYFKKACEIQLAGRGISCRHPFDYNLSNAKGVFANTDKAFSDTDFMRAFYTAEMLNYLSMTDNFEKFKNSRMLVTYLGDYFFHDALKKMRAVGAKALAVDTQTSTRVMNDYLYGLTQKCDMSDARVQRVTDLLVGQTRKALGMTASNHEVQSVLSRYDHAMGAATVNRVVEASWKRVGLLNPALKESYLKER